MRTISNDEVATPKTNKQSQLETFSATLKDGRVITVREMTGRDILYMEKELAKATEFERGMKMIERLVVGDEKITYEEIIDLSNKEIKKLSDIVAQASGTDEDDPN